MSQSLLIGPLTVRGEDLYKYNNNNHSFIYPQGYLYHLC